MKKAIFLLVIFLSLNGHAVALEWDVLNEDMADISDWADNDALGGVSSQETFDGKSCMKLYVPGADPDEDAYRQRYLSSVSNFTCEFSFYVDDPGVGGDNALLRFIYLDATTDILDWRAYEEHMVIRVPGGAVYHKADCHFAPQVWHTVRIVKQSTSVSFWVNNMLYFYNVTPYSGDYTRNDIRFNVEGTGGSPKTIYVAFCRVDTTQEHLAVSPLNIGSEKIVVRYRQNTDDEFYPNGAEALRMYGPTCYGAAPKVLSIPLVAADDGDASKVRFDTGSATKSLMKLPE